jgi:outer membrane protein OmpA-like peptidoglycan-associated protein
MKMKMFIVAALALVSLGATAQRTERVIDRVDSRTVQEFDHQEVTQKFKSHAFINLQGGAQYTLGEAKFKDLISPNVQAAIGYQFTPVFAARIQANAWQSKGGWSATTNENLKNYKYKYVAPGIDFMFNLSNLFCGWNPDRVFNVTAFLGGGANIAFDNDEVNEVAKAVGADLGQYELEYVWDGTKVRPFGRAGLQLGFRLSDAVHFLIEGNANILSDKYNSKKAGNPDWYFNALAGFRINLGKSRLVETHDIYRDVVVYDTIYKEVVVDDGSDRIAEDIRRDIFFQRNKTNIEETEVIKIKDIADYLNKYPRATVSIKGYADAGTGNDRINDRLAQQRADVVVKSLIEDYGISADRISYDSFGARVQPFTENDLNRVSICIATCK